MNTNILAVAILALLIGLGAGYFAGNSRQNAPMAHDMHAAMRGMTGGLEGKEGEAFEKAFIDEMVVHHEGAVEMARMVLERSERPELLKLASEIISAQTAEIVMMRQWLAAW